ncbi:crossover junction endodeoxyribonuclease RuvC [Tritonibacter horizontis]|uniref:Crossover junction endodeoxyribonuclease RuvC n=1 Tax=Tritonibacter horizontis TaxID=1768241 RepID=A0A132BWE6_9RHOB|nr:crossover junction endodeoxyribonuclease RuvC [Tritonibacter horizontis]
MPGGQDRRSGLENILLCSRFVLGGINKNQTLWQTAGKQVRILGIDPGLRSLGWGVIESNGARLSHVANGVCQSDGDDLGERLLSLHNQVTEIILAYAPDEAAIEQTFVNKDGAGTLKLGQARGVALLTLAKAGLPVGEYAPNRVKKTVVGVGHAEKEQVLHMVKLQLPGSAPKGPDAADALAIAICHAYYGGTKQRQLKEVRA